MSVARALLRKTVLWGVLCAGFALLAQSRPMQEWLAAHFVPAATAISDEDALANYMEQCRADVLRRHKAAARGGDYFLSPDTSACIDMKASPANLQEGRALHLRDHIWGEKRRISYSIDEGAHVAAAAMGLALFLRVLVNIWRLLAPSTLVASVLGRLRQGRISLRSHNAEREFMRYKRLFDNGLIDEKEFIAKKALLKAKILAG